MSGPAGNRTSPVVSAGGADVLVARGVAGRRKLDDVLRLVVLAGTAAAGTTAADRAGVADASETAVEAYGELARPPDSDPLTCGSSGAG